MRSAQTHFEPNKDHYKFGNSERLAAKELPVHFTIASVVQSPENVATRRWDLVQPVRRAYDGLLRIA